MSSQFSTVRNIFAIGSRSISARAIGAFVLGSALTVAAPAQSQEGQFQNEKIMDLVVVGKVKHELFTQDFSGEKWDVSEQQKSDTTALLKPGFSSAQHQLVVINPLNNKKMVLEVSPSVYNRACPLSFKTTMSEETKSSFTACPYTDFSNADRLVGHYTQNSSGNYVLNQIAQPLPIAPTSVQPIILGGNGVGFAPCQKPLAEKMLTRRAASERPAPVFVLSQKG